MQFTTQDITHFGTATRSVSMYSESAMKFSFWTTSANDRTDRLPLYTFERCSQYRDSNSRLLTLHLDQGAFGEVVALKLVLHDIING